MLENWSQEPENLPVIAFVSSDLLCVFVGRWSDGLTKKIWKPNRENKWISIPKQIRRSPTYTFFFSLRCQYSRTTLRCFLVFSVLILYKPSSTLLKGSKSLSGHIILKESSEYDFVFRKNLETVRGHYVYNDVRREITYRLRTAFMTWSSAVAGAVSGEGVVCI